MKAFSDAIGADHLRFCRIKTQEAGLLILFWLVTGATMKYISSTLDIAESTASKVLGHAKYGLEAFSRNLHPRSMEELRAITQNFHNAEGRNWPLWSQSLCLWLDGYDVRWWLRRDDGATKQMYRSFKLKASSLKTCVAWACNGEAMWCSGSTPAVRSDQSLMKDLGPPGTDISYYNELLQLYPVEDEESSFYSADKGFTHPLMVTPIPNPAPNMYGINDVLKGLGLSINERFFGCLKGKFKFLKKARCRQGYFNVFFRTCLVLNNLELRGMEYCLALTPLNNNIWVWQPNEEVGEFDIGFPEPEGEPNPNQNALTNLLRNFARNHRMARARSQPTPNIHHPRPPPVYSQTISQTTSGPNQSIPVENREMPPPIPSIDPIEPHMVPPDFRARINRQPLVVPPPSPPETELQRLLREGRMEIERVTAFRQEIDELIQEMDDDEERNSSPTYSPLFTDTQEEMEDSAPEDQPQLEVQVSENVLEIVQESIPQMEVESRCDIEETVDSDGTDTDEVQREVPEYIVEGILNSKEIDGVTLYLVKWRGYDAVHNSWEPESNLIDEDTGTVNSELERYKQSRKRVQKKRYSLRQNPPRKRKKST